MKRYTTEDPQSMVESTRNCCIVKENEVYLRDWNGEGDISICDYCRKQCKEKCNIDIEAGAEEFEEYMDCDCVVSAFYFTAVGFAENRERLKRYEDEEEAAACGNGTLFERIAKTPDALAEYLAIDKKGGNDGCASCHGLQECTGKEYCKALWLRALTDKEGGAAEDGK